MEYEIWRLFLKQIIPIFASNKNLLTETKTYTNGEGLNLEKDV